jgi:hypothetical protein
MARKEHKFHYIYKITNTKNGKYYIGMHSTGNLEDGYMGGGKRIRNSIRKHGIEVHTKEIIEFLDDRESLAKREKEIVNESLLQDPLCMNLMIGGQGGWDQWNNISHIQRDRGIKGNLKMKYLKENDPEWVKSRYEKMSEGQILAYKEGRKEKSYFYDWNGKKHSEKTKEKMSESRKGKKMGHENSQYGRCWIFNEEYKINKVIHVDDLPGYIEKGWIRGMKMEYFNKK